MPLPAYHYPAMSSPGIRVEHLTDLPVAGCNDSGDDPARLLQELSQFDGDIYVGDTTFLLLAGMVGAAEPFWLSQTLSPSGVSPRLEVT
jgi:4-hydroxy-tetrahydrodipicolinate synthase